MESNKMASVCILFVGIGIAYQKAIGGENCWHVLLPFNDCHSVKFSYAMEDGVPVFYGHLAQQGALIEIESKFAQSVTGSTPNFAHVLDLTAGDTHAGVMMREDWNKKGVLLTIENAVFSVYNYLQSYPVVNEYDVFLLGGAERPLGAEAAEETDATVRTEGVKKDMLAHMVCANIGLGEEGSIDIKFNGTSIFSTEPGRSYTLRFDNNCERESSEDQNSPFTTAGSDMQLFYELFSDVQDQTRQFRIKGIKKLGGSVASETAIPENDSLCNFAGKMNEGILSDLKIPEEPENSENPEIEQVSKGAKPYKVPEIEQVSEDAKPGNDKTGPLNMPQVEIEKPCMFVQITKPEDLP